ncbi:MAG TPA: leucyl/phenylalanyl-tRNA--protein transferase [Saprospiraceae bacterium]|nr:leucyl/phenylalanyl-tRNA--protein transferase [Saprospiraceae bacterium]
MLYHSPRVILYNNQDGTMPHPYLADEHGLLCYAMMDDPTTLLHCYRFGIFPWDNVDKIGAFYFPSKRYVIEPRHIKIPKSIRSYFNNHRFTITFDTQFEMVIRQCASAKRKDQASTWISEQFIKVYTQMFQQGHAHSVEVWQGDKLVGGLYGIAVGRVFTGESMFSHESNASRFAMISLAKFLEKHNFSLIDCQVYNPYLTSFGGQEIPAQVFFEHMKHNFLEPDLIGPWTEL